MRLYLVETDAFGYADSLRQQLEAAVNPVERCLGRFQSDHRPALLDLLASAKNRWDRAHTAHLEEVCALTEAGRSLSQSDEARLRQAEDAEAKATDEAERALVDMAMRAAHQAARAARPNLSDAHYYSRRARWFSWGAGLYREAAGQARQNWARLDAKHRMRAITHAVYGFHFAREAARLAALPPPDSTALNRYTHPLRHSPSATRHSPSATRHPLASPRQTILLNGDWEFSFDGGPDRPPEQWHRLAIPHGAAEGIRYLGRGDLWKEHWHPLKDPGAIPRHYWYRCGFDAPPWWVGQHIAFQCDSSWNHTEVFLNGRYCGEHYGGIEPFEVDLTARVVPGARNILLLMVESTFLTDFHLLPLAGYEPGPNWYVTNRFWGWGRGGIFQDCRLVVTHPLRVTDLFACPQMDNGHLICEVTLANGTPRPQPVRVAPAVYDAGRPVLRLPEKKACLAAGAASTVGFRQSWPNPVKWGIGGRYGDPKLYHLRVELRQGSQLLDVQEIRFGVRDFAIDGLQFKLNGQVLPLQGDSLMPEPYAWNRWFTWAYCHLARGANFNLVRHHGGVDSPEAAFDAADEAGFLVEPECFVGTWAPWDLSGGPNFEDPVWSANWRRQVAGMVREHRSHPSLALWSAENETLYHIELPFYEEQKNWFYDQFDVWIRRHAPHVIVDHHGSSLNQGEIDVDPRSQVVNIHYGDPAAAAGWPERFGHRPILIGEMSGIVWATPSQEQLMKSLPREQAARYEESNADWYRQEITRFHAQKTPNGRDCVAGLMPFTFTSSMLATCARPEGMGPWGDLVSRPDYQPSFLDVSWPACNRSGPHPPAPSPHPGRGGARRWIEGRSPLPQDWGRGRGWRTPERLQSKM